MSAKRARKSKNFHNNVVQINNYLHEKQKTVKIVPRNRAQESYMLTLANPKKDVVFGIGPAGTGKTLIAVLTAIKFFKEGIVDASSTIDGKGSGFRFGGSRGRC